MNETVNKQLNECLNQLKMKMNDLNTVYHKMVEQVKPHEEMLFTSTNFKVYGVCYHGEEVLNRYGIDEDVYQDLFEDFCEMEMLNLEDAVLETCGKYRKYSELLTWIGRTSSFYINPWFDRYGETVEEFVFDYLEDNYSTAFEYLVLKGGSIVSTLAGVRDDDFDEYFTLENYMDQLEEEVDILTDLIYCIEKNGTVVDDDDFKDCVFLYNYLENFKENQVEIFEVCYVQPYAEELLEEKKRERMEELEDEENKYKALTNALNIDREAVQDIILLVWNKLTEAEKEKLVKLSSRGTR